MPRYLEPMKATLATKPFRDEDWLFEVKWDGYRVEAVVRDGKVELFTRNGHDAETYFPRLLTPPTWIERPRGDRGRRGGRARRPRAGRTSGCSRSGSARGGRTAGAARVPGVRPAPPRRALAAGRPPRGAQEAARAGPPADARVSRSRRAIDDRGDRVLRGGQGPGRSRGSSPSTAGPATSRAGGRRPGSRSRSGRSRSWSSAAGRRGRGARRSWAPSWSASTRASGCGSRARWARGSTARTRADLRARARGPRDRRAAVRPAAAADYKGRWGGDLAGVRWVRPELVIRAEIGGWSRDGHVRQAAYKGLEPGRDPREVVRERAVDPAKAEREAGRSRAGDASRPRQRSRP